MNVNKKMEAIEFGKPHEICAGLYLLRMPLPFRLNHINLYLLDDGDSWILVDSGMNNDQVKAIWSKLILTFFKEKPISKVVLTHLHPDHIGLSAWLQNILDIPVYISELDWEQASNIWKNDTQDGLAKHQRLYTQFGVGGGELDFLLENRSGYKKLVKALPKNVKFIKEGDCIQTAGGDWLAKTAVGHTPEHICLWNEKSRILISGDHILPTITPNISILAHGLGNPLQSYLDSLKSFKELPCKYYCPAHGPVSTNFVERIDEILRHHEEKFEVLQNLSADAITVKDAMPVLFGRDLPIQQYMFALGETAAHLICMEAQDRLSKTFRQKPYGNQWLFQSVQADLNRCPDASLKAVEI